MSIVTALVPVIVLLSVGGCSESSNSLASTQIAKASRAYGEGDVATGDRLFLEVRSRHVDDVVVLDSLRLLAQEFHRAELVVSTSAELKRQVAQRKVAEIYRRLLLLALLDDATEFLQHNGTGVLPPEIHGLLQAQLAIQKGEADLGLQTLSRIASEQLSQVLAIEHLRLRVRANNMLGNREALEPLRLEASTLFPDEASRELFWDRELSRKASDPAFAEQRRKRVLKYKRTGTEVPTSLGHPPDGAIPACHGRSVFNGVELWGSQPACADGAAFIGADVPHINNMVAFFRPEVIPVIGYCCPLPPGDILTDATRYVESTCPNDHVVTAALPRCSLVKRVFELATNRDGECGIALECRKINTAKYALGESTEGLHWGEGFTIWLQKRSIPRAAVPYSIREAIGRFGKYLWQPHGCLGEPFGSFLVSKSAKRCKGFGFRQLLYRAGPQQANGTPVKLFPTCSRRIDPFTESPYCKE